MSSNGIEVVINKETLKEQIEFIELKKKFGDIWKVKF